MVNPKKSKKLENVGNLNKSEFGKSTKSEKVWNLKSTKSEKVGNQNKKEIGKSLKSENVGNLKK